jgi:AraC-like DNA-binding protein
VSQATKLIIKNMVCPRCVEAVREVFAEAAIPVDEVGLGYVALSVRPDGYRGTREQKEKLRDKLSERGFELLDDKQTQLINSIKSLIIEQIHYAEEPTRVNYSTYLSDNLHYDYAYLSRLFSAVEGRTIEKFIIAQKVEKVKELLTYGELTLSEIAAEMEYSSSAHLSAQFKKVTGLSPSAFKQMQRQERRGLDEV